MMRNGRRGFVAWVAVFILLVSGYASADAARAYDGAVEASGASAATSADAGFIGAMLNAGKGSTSEKEGCFGCNFLLRRAYASAQGANIKYAPLADDIQNVLEIICAEPVPVFSQACESLLQVKTESSNALAKGKKFTDVCSTVVQLCWMGLMMG